jgi:hypothetical protein
MARSTAQDPLGIIAVKPPIHQLMIALFVILLTCFRGLTLRLAEVRQLGPVRTAPPDVIRTVRLTMLGTKG